MNSIVKIYNKEAKEVGEIKLNPKVFNIEVNSQLVHQAMVTLLANKRVNYAQAKDRSEVRGGGAKPWRQKGTGRARHGSSRSPIWIGGGVTFGPNKERNYSKQINKKMKKKALLMVLSDKANNDSILSFEEGTFEKPQVKVMADFLKGMKIKTKKTLFIINKMDLNFVKSIRNIEKTEIIAANSLNVYDLLNADKVIISKDSFKTIEELYLNK